MRAITSASDIDIRAPGSSPVRSIRATYLATTPLEIASAGPLEVGLLHSATGSWNAPVAVLFALTGVLLAAGLLAARPRVLPASSRR